MGAPHSATTSSMIMIIKSSRLSYDIHGEASKCISGMVTH